MSDPHLLACSKCFRPWMTGGCDTVGCDGHETLVPAHDASRLEERATLDRLHALSNQAQSERDEALRRAERLEEEVQRLKTRGGVALSLLPAAKLEKFHERVAALGPAGEEERGAP